MNDQPHKIIITSPEVAADLARTDEQAARELVIYNIASAVARRDITPQMGLDAANGLGEQWAEGGAR